MKADTRPLYINNHQELFDSVVEFYESPELWRKILGSAPRYFVHTIKDGQHYFAMSKFCVIKNVTGKSYIEKYRNITEGNNSQRIIVNRLNEEWIPRNQIKKSIRDAFDTWMGEFFPKYRLENAKFISIKISKSYQNKKRDVTPDELQKQLELQQRIGDVGELIAIHYEIERLRSQGIKNPEKHIKHIAHFSVSAGFDILTITSNEERYIEVKSSLSQKGEFYLSENEVKTLEGIGKDSYLYLVKIKDLKKIIGDVYEIIQNPILKLKKDKLLKPIAYKVNLKIR